MAYTVFYSTPGGPAGGRRLSHHQTRKWHGCHWTRNGVLKRFWGLVALSPSRLLTFFVASARNAGKIFAGLL